MVIKERVLQSRHEKQAAIYSCKVLLNCYLRECSNVQRQHLKINKQNQTFSLHFQASQETIIGKFAFYSINGEHEYAYFSLQNGQALSFSYLASLIVQEYTVLNTAITQDYVQDFMKRVENSYRNMAIFLEHSSEKPIKDYLSSEQSLIYGHPFHPYPKNTVGFTSQEVAAYCPELRTSFALCYIAVRNDVFQETWVTESAANEYLEKFEYDVCKQLNLEDDNYRILPMHPWQYAYVQTLEVVKEYERQQKILFLGRSGPVCYPTSSVRTVYIPQLKCNLKLSLSIQITNMLRVNSQEQMKRTLDAAHYLLDQDCFIEEEYTKVLYETGVCTCCFNDNQITALFTITYRPMVLDEASTYVVASLLEAPIQGKPCRLFEWLKEQKVDKWFRQYLNISLLPIVRLAENKGIHFEAHLQNTLITIREGKPYIFWIRDLEGVSIEKEKVAKYIQAKGPLFYDKEQAWSRTEYYFIVNHLGSFIHALARDFHLNEDYFWQIVREALLEEWEQNRSELIVHLLTTNVFYAKKNLYSCLIGKSETPEYVAVKNAMYKGNEIIWNRR
ncbi:IucA/IucC family protein [Lysinibacillus sp. FSL W8-0992]|uniref:IucA/IucC family protein n=1 Tax=Lysinibacillus sp. FSL W8-0992 TaxID=2954643 RepID=UPI0030F887A8